MAKLSGSSDAQVIDLAHRILATIAADDRIEGTDETSIDPALSLEALLYVAAAIIEADSGNQTARALREAGEGAGEVLRSFTRLMRDMHLSEGRHGIELIGANLQPAPLPN